MLRIHLADSRNESSQLEDAVHLLNGVCFAELWESEASVFVRPSDLSSAGQRAAAGQHILVIDSAHCVAEIDRLAEACSNINAKLMFARTARHRAYPQAIADSLQAGLLGEPGLVRIHHWQPKDARITATERLTDEIDIACSLFGTAPEVIFGLRVGDGFQAHLGFPSGGMALIGCVNELPQDAEPYYTITLIGSRGAAYADDHHNSNLLIGKTTTGLTVRGAVNPYESILRNFVDFVSDNTMNEQTIHAAKRAAAVAAAAIEASESGNTLKLVGERYEL